VQGTNQTVPVDKVGRKAHKSSSNQLEVDRHVGVAIEVQHEQRTPTNAKIHDLKVPIKIRQGN
jgi:hypothetical protein